MGSKSVLDAMFWVIKNKENTRAFRRGMNPTTHSTNDHR